MLRVSRKGQKVRDDAVCVCVCFTCRLSWCSGRSAGRTWTSSAAGEGWEGRSGTSLLSLRPAAQTEDDDTELKAAQNLHCSHNSQKFQTSPPCLSFAEAKRKRMCGIFCFLELDHFAGTYCSHSLIVTGIIIEEQECIDQCVNRLVISGRGRSGLKFWTWPESLTHGRESNV